MITLLITIYLTCLAILLILFLDKNRKESIKDMYRCKGNSDELNAEWAKTINESKASNDNPTRNGCGEWISGKRLEEIIKIMKG